ncbi:MAG: FKBP-type peptidyl-prolyl cis-trans isomerase [Lewinellaceae bacterium]|nr:FKBP-type peptidyl-prolyl cis-trans isomerase [Saprospiraceae bacterium]MCB9317253.1 FKBP-type peptidyl-prolyl cis-trans isomerase [Lewinellaceae bacterium]MCB9331498.1 FKBP-type peptidyl-prolyl cis-trans isomerase [Lewinellaceae bacterium]
MRNLLILALAATALFFTACKSDGIKTEHGYRFVNHTDKGGVKPQPGEAVLVQSYVYIGDSLMSSSQKRFGGPQEYTLYPKDQLPERVPALYDAMLLMGEGDSATIFEPIDSFLQQFIPPGLKDAKEVRHELVLVDVITKDEKEKAKAEAEAKFQAVQNKTQSLVQEYAAGKLADKLTTTESGLKLLIEEKGTGGPVKTGEQVRVHYYGCLTTGQMFDNSYQRGEPYPFPAGVGQMIPGFDEGVMQLNHGGSAHFFIPSKLGYGEQAAGGGQIPPNSELIFYVEVL